MRHRTFFLASACHKVLFASRSTYNSFRGFTALKKERIPYTLLCMGLESSKGSAISVQVPEVGGARDRIKVGWE